MDLTYNILIVDDIKVNIKFLEVAIKKHFKNINIYSALSAKDGFDILSKNAIDIILLDIASRAVLTVLAKTDANLGLILLLARKSCTQLAELI